MSSILSLIARRAASNPIILNVLRQQQQKSTNLMCTIAGSTRSYQPTPLEKKFLVWTGKYSKVDEVPNLIK
jgi:hypothetical protein